MDSAEALQVEVVYALPQRQVVRVLSLPAGSRVVDAIRASRLVEEFPEIDSATCALGIFGERVDPDTALRTGDRVEIYRPLQADPRETRRRRAARRKRT